MSKAEGYAKAVRTGLSTAGKVERVARSRLELLKSIALLKQAVLTLTLAVPAVLLSAALGGIPWALG